MCIIIVLIQGNEKSFMSFAAVFVVTLKTVNFLPKDVLNIDIKDLCLLPCF